MIGAGGRRSYEHLLPYISQALGVSPADLERAYRPAVATDIPAILAFRRTVHPQIWWDDAAYVDWRYFSGPARGDEACYWVIALGGEIQGACGLEPVRLAIDGRTVPAVRTMDIMVRPELDGLGLGVLMNVILFRHFPISLVTGSNEKSDRLLKRLFHHTTDLQMWRLPIRSSGLIGRKINLGPLADVTASAADLFLKFRRARRRLAVPRGMALREIERFDARADELGRACEIPGRVVVRRSGEYLNWRFMDNPRCRYHAIGAFADGRLLAYVVTRLNDIRPNPQREGEIVDWLVAPQSDARLVLAALIQAAVDALELQGARLVSCAASDGEAARILESAGFRHRPAEAVPFFVHAADADVEARLASGEDWLLTRGDLDVE